MRIKIFNYNMLILYTNMILANMVVIALATAGILETVITVKKPQNSTAQEYASEKYQSILGLQWF